MADPLRIVIATGGSGGHLFPAILLAQELQDKKHDIFFLGSFGTCIEQLIGTGFRFENLYAKGLKIGNIKDFLVSGFSILKASVRSIKFLMEFKPHVVIGFGGYGAFPVVFSAAMLGFPTMIHEQNVIPGKANAILAKIVKKVAISFQESKRFFKVQKTVLTGYPFRARNKSLTKEDCYREFKLKEGIKTVLVFGGSQGSHAINVVSFQAFKDLSEKGFLFQVLHATGEKDYGFFKEQYRTLNVPYFLSPFINNMPAAYQIADVVISRSGAGTVTELGIFKVPSILIPYPYTGGHQKENALVLVRSSLACMIEEKDLSPASLSDQIIRNLNMEKSHNLTADQKDLFLIDSTHRLVQEVEMLTART